MILRLRCEDNKCCYLKFIIIFIDYYYIDANDYNDVFVVHDVGLMIIMMITIMH